MWLDLVLFCEGKLPSSDHQPEKDTQIGFIINYFADVKIYLGPVFFLETCLFVILDGYLTIWTGDYGENPLFSQFVSFQSLEENNM